MPLTKRTKETNAIASRLGKVPKLSERRTPVFINCMIIVERRSEKCWGGVNTTGVLL